MHAAAATAEGFAAVDGPKALEALLQKVIANRELGRPLRKPPAKVALLFRRSLDSLPRLFDAGANVVDSVVDTASRTLHRTARTTTANNHHDDDR
jgi:hypothetical protein